MPVQHSPPERKTRSQERTQANLTQKLRAPLDGAPEVPQLRAHGLSRSSSKGLCRYDEEEGPEGTEVLPAPVGAFEGAGGTTLAQYNRAACPKSETSLFDIMQQMTQTMANLQADSSSESSRPPDLKTLSMKAPDCFDGTQP
ncbi:hypothetical protein O181_010485 [Austropuccinia psidii MF-1]|uniref:Uncharacterized protein n=1 Tax=Austropuccinia psidii MF-1 TaxID=1389203 RepID=A0A9Q3GKY3_9BASI|nr:hypothetical protein [Austropuccinia psidii MF-1]